MKQALNPVEIGGHEYEVVAASASAQVLGTAGSVNDFLARVIVNVTTSATGNVAIKDGADAAITIMPVNAPIGAYSIEIGLRSRTGAWAITTGAGASAIAVGQFSI